MTKAQAMGGICTVSISPAIFVQGAFVAARPDGRIVVRVGDRDFLGHPISTTQSTGAPLIPPSGMPDSRWGFPSGPISDSMW